MNRELGERPKYKDQIRLLSVKWRDLMKGVGLPADFHKNEFNDIISQYLRKGHHNLGHLYDMFTIQSISGMPPYNRLVVGFATFDHDYVYNPLSITNEEDSVRVSTARLTRLGVPEQLNQKVGRIILASKDHRARFDNDLDFAVFSDSDMAVLAFPGSGYSRYLRGLWHEYTLHVGAEVFVKGRIEFLERTKQRQIFFTPFMIQNFHSQAMQNIERELAHLQKLKDPQRGYQHLRFD